MGQIAKRKKKGRPSKADLARRSGSPSTAPESDVRRSLRRRNVRYNIDYDDYLDEDEEDEAEEERRREKKLKLVLKLNQDEDDAEPHAPCRGRLGARGRRAVDDDEDKREEKEEEEVDEDEEDCEKKPVKKKRINGGDDDEDDDEDVDRGDDDEEERGRKAGAKGRDSGSGMPRDPSSGTPLPNKKSLELILDKLQKKDTYGVYAEPVAPEELPDYHDVIEHPMDFSTVRKKFASGSYPTLEQFERDVFLICSNAMQYNAPDTIYHKQARSIQELAKKKFDKIRMDIIERAEKELKSEQKLKSTFSVKKPVKKPFNRALQEPVGSDFSSGATLATAGDTQNGMVATQPGGYERPNNTDGIVDGYSVLVDKTVEKVEELSSGKGLLTKFGRKSFAVDENRRTTYNISNQPVLIPDSVFTTFESEIKQLVAVGLHAENSYARSLARFAATLGPVAWKVASQRIEQALPAGCKFGRGWVGEYEPLPTPVLMLETRAQKESPLFTKLQSSVNWRKDDMHVKTAVLAKEQPVSGAASEGKSSFFHPVSGKVSEGKPSFISSPGAQRNSPFNATNQQVQNPLSWSSVDTQKKVSKQVELNLPPAPSQSNVELVPQKQKSNRSETAVLRSREMITRNATLLQSAPQKQLDNNAVSAGLPNGKVTNNGLNNRMVSPSSDIVANQMARAATYFPHSQEHGLNEPVQVVRMLAEKVQKQQTPSSQQPVDALPATSSVPSIKRDDSSNAAAAAARAWMSIGARGLKQANEASSPKNQISAESLYNPAREFHPQIARIRGEFPLSAGMQFSPEKFPLQAFAPQPVRGISEAQFQNRPVVFPQFVAADLARFQVPSPRRGLSPHVVQPRPKQETFPPDLNIGCQSPGSPVKQSSGVIVDSQQPDLALQL